MCKKKKKESYVVSGILEKHFCNSSVQKTIVFFTCCFHMHAFACRSLRFENKINAQYLNPLSILGISFGSLGYKGKL